MMFFAVKLIAWTLALIVGTFTLLTIGAALASSCLYHSVLSDSSFTVNVWCGVSETVPSCTNNIV